MRAFAGPIGTLDPIGDSDTEVGADASSSVGGAPTVRIDLHDINNEFANRTEHLTERQMEVPVQKEKTEDEAPTAQFVLQSVTRNKLAALQKKLPQRKETPHELPVWTSNKHPERHRRSFK